MTRHLANATVYLRHAQLFITVGGVTHITKGYNNGVHVLQRAYIAGRGPNTDPNMHPRATSI